MNFVKSILSNQFHQNKSIIYFILSISFYQFHFISFILSISSYQIYSINFISSFLLSILSQKFILYTLELISSKYSKFLHSVEGNPPFSSCMDLAIKKFLRFKNQSLSSDYTVTQNFRKTPCDIIR